MGVADGKIHPKEIANWVWLYDIPFPVRQITNNTCVPQHQFRMSSVSDQEKTDDGRRPPLARAQDTLRDSSPLSRPLKDSTSVNFIP